MRAGVLIVGGGVMGTSIALHLAQRSDPLAAPVVLLERRHLGAGSSGRSGAILRQMYSERVVAAMARDSLREYRTFQNRTGRPIGFRQTGVLTLAGPDRPEWQARLLENLEMLSALKIDATRVEADDIRVLFPGIALRPGTLGVWEPGAGFVDPLRTVEAFGALARTHGAVTRMGVEMTRLCIEGARVVGAETSDEAYQCEVVVIVAGPWTKALLAREGIDLPLRVVRPEGHFLAMPGAEEEGEPVEEREEGGDELEDPLQRVDDRLVPKPAGPRVAHPVLIDLEHGLYTRCEPSRGRTRIGRVDYESDRELADPDALDEDVGADFRAWSRDALVKRLPVYASQPDVGSQAALYTLTPDAQALIGPVRGVAGLFVVTGFSGHGFKLAPSVGLGVSQMVHGEPVSAFDPEFFSPYRFEEERSSRGRAFGL